MQAASFAIIAILVIQRKSVLKTIYRETTEKIYKKGLGEANEAGLTHDCR